MPTRKLASLHADGAEVRLLQYFVMCGVWSLTTYDACDLACSYCVSYAQGSSAPAVHPDHVVEQLRRELRDIPADGIIGLGGIIDCYPHAEATHEVTRAALGELVAQGRGLRIVTKGTLIQRDLDLLVGHPDVSVNVSLPSLDEDVLARIEPKAPTAAERLATIEVLNDAGIAVQLHAQPWIPGMTDALAMVELAGGRFPVCFGPLNVQSPTVASTQLGRRFDQRDINEGYVREMKRVGMRPRVTWQRPVWLGEELLAASQWKASLPESMQASDACLDPVGGAAGRPTASASCTAPRSGGIDATASIDHVDHEARNLAAAGRLMETYLTSDLGMVALEYLSPHIRCYAGTFPDRALASEGAVAAQALLRLTDAMRDPSFEVGRTEVRGAIVHVEARLAGVLVDDVDDHRAGDHVAVDLATTYRFDDHGLVVEQWQQAAARDIAVA